MTITATHDRAPARATLVRLAGSPLVWIGAFLIFVLLGLALPWRLPLGPNYWDTAVYLDAIHRIGLGQAPGLDFFAPVGPAGFYFAAALDALFPDAPAKLLVNWAVLPVALPVLALIARNVGGRSRLQALALTVPFLAFAALPINLHGLYPMPGFDGYGAYNRHAALLLYLLVATLLFVEGRRLATALVAVLMLALFLFKITGAVAGTLIVGYAMLAGRMRFTDAALAAGATILALAGLDLATGLVRDYVADILTLLAMNTDALLPRFLTVASVKLNVVLPVTLLIAALAWAALRDGGRATPEGLRAVLASPLGWLAACFAALAFYETQNTGSLEFLGLWPVLLLILLDWRRHGPMLGPAVLVLALAASLPSAVICVERAGRALLGAPTYAALPAPDLGPLGRVGAKRDIVARAEGMLAHYAAHPQAYADLVARNLLPSYILYSEIDYQAVWLLELEEGARALKLWEEANGRKLDGIFTLDFVNPMSRILDRAAPRHVAIGVDLSRTVPALTPETLAALAGTDAILQPKCPVTTARAEIAAHFAPALAGREIVRLSPCWDLHLKR